MEDKAQKEPLDFSSYELRTPIVDGSYYEIRRHRDGNPFYANFWTHKADGSMDLVGLKTATGCCAFDTFFEAVSACERHRDGAANVVAAAEE